MVCLDVRLEDCGDSRALSRGDVDVFVDKVFMGVDHSQLTGRVAAEDVRRTGGLIVENLAKQHCGLPFCCASAKRNPGANP